MDNLFELADELRRLREIKSDIKIALEDTNSKIDAVEKKMVDSMSDSECPSFTRGDKKFIMTTTPNWSAESDCKEELYDVLKNRGLQHLFTINSRTLSSFIRDTVDDTEDENGETHIPDWLDGLVKCYDKVGITMRKA